MVIFVNKLEFVGQEVRYYRIDEPTQEFGPFAKLDLYNWQKEYRLLAALFHLDFKSLIIKFEDISDITVMGSTQELIQQIHIDDNEQLVIPGFDGEKSMQYKINIFLNRITVYYWRRRDEFTHGYII